MRLLIECVNLLVHRLSLVWELSIIYTPLAVAILMWQYTARVKVTQVSVVGVASAVLVSCDTTFPSPVACGGGTKGIEAT